MLEICTKNKRNLQIFDRIFLIYLLYTRSVVELKNIPTFPHNFIFYNALPQTLLKLQKIETIVK